MIESIIKIAEEAGQILMKYYQEELDIELKRDEFDFVTQADKKLDEYIRNKLTELFPSDLILSEESNHIPEIFSGNVWMVDPLDGTKDFVNKGTGFSVMIGLCENGVPTVGVVYAPAKGKLYFAEKGKGAYLRVKGVDTRLSVSNISNLSDSRIVTRHKQGESRDSDIMIDNLPKKEEIPESSVGVKLGLISEGLAEVQIHTNTRGSKWDTCAPQIILEEAGGKLTNHNGESLDYKQDSLIWLDSFVGTNNSVHREVVQYLIDYKKDQ